MFIRNDTNFVAINLNNLSNENCPIAKDPLSFRNEPNLFAKIGLLFAMQLRPVASK